MLDDMDWEWPESARDFVRKLQYDVFWGDGEDMNILELGITCKAAALMRRKRHRLRQYLHREHLARHISGGKEPLPICYRPP